MAKPYATLVFFFLNLLAMSCQLAKSEQLDRVFMTLRANLNFFKCDNVWLENKKKRKENKLKLSSSSSERRIKSLPATFVRLNVCFIQTWRSFQFLFQQWEFKRKLGALTLRTSFLNPSFFNPRRTSYPSQPLQFSLFIIPLDKVRHWIRLRIRTKVMPEMILMIKMDEEMLQSL